MAALPRRQLLDVVRDHAVQEANAILAAKIDDAEREATHRGHGLNVIQRGDGAQCQARVAARFGVGGAAAILVVLEHQRRDRARLAVAVDGHEREVGLGRVAARGGARILGLDAHADLHRRLADEVDLRLQPHDLAEMDRREERQAVDRRRDHVAARVAHAGHRRGDVDPLHHLAAEDRAERVGVAGQDDLRHLDARSARRLCRPAVAHGLSRNSAALSSTRRSRSSPVERRMLGDESNVLGGEDVELGCATAWVGPAARNRNGARDIRDSPSPAEQ